LASDSVSLSPSSFTIFSTAKERAKQSQNDWKALESLHVHKARNKIVNSKEK